MNPVEDLLIYDPFSGHFVDHPEQSVFFWIFLAALAYDYLREVLRFFKRFPEKK